MIITTRYRDIPLEEIAAECKRPGYDISDSFRKRWESLRGTELRIVTPASESRVSGCSGPWYRVLGDPEFPELAVCHHLAEIGD